MKKLIIIFFVFSNFSLCGQIFIDSNEDLDLNLSGKVKHLIQERYEVIRKDGKIEKKLIECSEIEYELDSQNRILKETTSHNISDKRSVVCLFFSREYSYNSKGLLVYRKLNGDSPSTKYEYDDKGNIIFESSESREGWHYKYDENNNRTEKFALQAEGYLIGRWIMKYDKKNRKIEEYIVSVSEEPDTIPTDIVRTFEYDNKNRLISKIETYPDTEICAITTYKYNKKGDVIEYYSKNDFAGMENTQTFKYYYDKKGNWIKRIEVYNDVVETMTEREIEYW